VTLSRDQVRQLRGENFPEETAQTLNIRSVAFNADPVAAANQLAAILGRLPGLVPPHPQVGLSMYELMDVLACGTCSSAGGDTDRRIDAILKGDGRFSIAASNPPSAAGSTKWRT
jgi:hypothetical protein